MITKNHFIPCLTKLGWDAGLGQCGRGLLVLIFFRLLNYSNQQARWLHSMTSSLLPTLFIMSYLSTTERRVQSAIAAKNVNPDPRALRKLPQFFPLLLMFFV